MVIAVIAATTDQLTGSPETRRSLKITENKMTSIL